jgi:hypothetical protein
MTNFALLFTSPFSHEGVSSSAVPPSASAVSDEDHSSSRDDDHSSHYSNDANFFPNKLYGMLEDAEEQGFSHIVSWTKDCAFKVHRPDDFVNLILGRYFPSQSRYK